MEKENGTNYMNENNKTALFNNDGVQFDVASPLKKLRYLKLGTSVQALLKSDKLDTSLQALLKSDKVDTSVCDG